MTRFLKKIRYMLEYVGVMTAFQLVRLSPHAVLRGVAEFAGLALYLIPNYRRIMLANLKVAFPDETDAWRRRVGRRGMVNLVLSLLDFFWFTGRPDRIEANVVFPEPTMTMIRQTLDAGKGLIFICPHLGNWELASLAVKHFTPIKFAVVARMMPNPYLNDLISRGRMFDDTKVIPAKGAVKGMIQAMREGRFMATLIDQNTRVRQGGVFVDFFGLPVPTSRAPAMFGRKFGVKVVTGGCVRKNGVNTMYTVEMSKPAEDYESDEALIQELMATTERLIREHPEQYLWFYRRFQNIPRDATDELKAKFPFYAKPASAHFYFKRRGTARR